MPQTPEQKTRAKYNAAQRAMGRPMRIPNGPAVLHVRWLHDVMGMPLQLIADRSGTSLGCVFNQWKQATNEINRGNLDKILAVKPEQGGYRGAFVSPIGTGRRLGALAHEGYPIRWLVQHIGVAHNNLLRVYRWQAKSVYASTAERVAQAYDKFETRKPEEFGITLNVSRVSQHYARKHGHAPPMAWDPDTIDDPSAFAEWTGKCGSERGYRIHLELGHKFPTLRRGDNAPIMVSGCPVCRAAHDQYKRSHGGAP